MAPNMIGPGMEPKARNMTDCAPRASVRCSSATHLMGEGEKGRGEDGRERRHEGVSHSRNAPVINN